jgi:NTE family protein
MINLALQGGGSHGAFSWGVLDQLIEDGRIDIEGISGCSAGSMNAVVYAYGKIKGNDAARQALHDFWLAVSNEGQKFSIKPNPFEKMMGLQVTKTVISRSMSMMSRLVSPYQMNPSNINPLLKIIESQVVRPGPQPPDSGSLAAPARDSDAGRHRVPQAFPTSSGLGRQRGEARSRVTDRGIRVIES